MTNQKGEEGRGGEGVEKGAEKRKGVLFALPHGFALRPRAQPFSSLALCPAPESARLGFSSLVHPNLPPSWMR